MSVKLAICGTTEKYKKWSVSRQEKIESEHRDLNQSEPPISTPAKDNLGNKSTTQTFHLALKPSNVHFKSLLAATVASLLMPTIIASPAAAPPTSANLARRSQLLRREDVDADLALHDDDKGSVFHEVERVFDAISSIPDEVLEEGDDATHEWLAEHGYHNDKVRREDLTARNDLEDRGWWDVTRCVGAIAAFVASNTIGATKIFRIKQYIAALGGFKKAAELLLKASTWEERLTEGGQALALLAGEILGTSLVANNC